MKQYHDLLKQILGRGDVEYEPRTKTHTIGISGAFSVYDLREGFPLMTTKNVPPRLPFEEVLWKLRGERNVKGLVDRNVHIWTANAFDRHLREKDLREEIPKHSQRWNEEFDSYKERIATDPEFASTAGDLGPVYGYQWRHWRGPRGGEVDQLTNLLNNIREKPGSRYHALSSWNVGELSEMALGPCPFWHQFSVYGDNIDLTMVQRSCDVFLGVPFNITQDALLLELVARETGLKPRFFKHMPINVHDYLGVSPRSDFWDNQGNISEFQRRFREVTDRDGYSKLKDWYLENAPAESKGNENKDHTPFILEQLSKEPRALPRIELADIPLLEAIHKSALEIATITGYKPHKWDSKATMAA